MAGYRGVFRTWSNIYNGAFLQKYLTGFKLFTIFTRKAPSQKFYWVENRLRVWNIELTLFPSLQIKPRKYSAGKYVWHRLWKDNRSWWESKQNQGLCRSRRPKGSLKKVLWEISQNSQENIGAGISFLIKLN